jgi:hypothetical protein
MCAGTDDCGTREPAPALARTPDPAAATARHPAARHGSG